MFSRWILGTFNNSKQSELGWELMWVKHEYEDEDFLVDGMQFKL